MNQALCESDIFQRLTEEEKTFITLDIKGCARYTLPANREYL